MLSVSKAERIGCKNLINAKNDKIIKGQNIMAIEKKVLSNLTKCYSVAPLDYQGERHYLIASEKNFSCLLFNKYGELKEEVWKEPGGTMSIVQLPGSDGAFLATHKFYSPNDSKEAGIVLAQPDIQGGWNVRKLIDLPHVHRFDILTRNGVNYLIACTICSGREYKDDWSYPGKVYACELDDLLGMDFSMEKLVVLKENMLKNHGYFRHATKNGMRGIVTCEEGVFAFVPPEKEDGKWEIDTLLEQPVSDAVLLDLDGDGQEELVALAPFHGGRTTVYHHSEKGFVPVYNYDGNVDFAHAICACEICGVPTVVIGYRKGNRYLISICFDKETKEYNATVLDKDVGSANVMHDIVDGRDILISANREINEVAYYIIT